METIVINLQPLFEMNNSSFVKGMTECFTVLNAFLKSKSGVTHEPLYVKELGNSINIGYVPLDKKKTNFYSDQTFGPSWDTLSKICGTQFAIFEGCKTYGCFENVPMAGAPEEGHNAFFEFVHEGKKYHYDLWKKE